MAVPCQTRLGVRCLAWHSRTPGQSSPRHPLGNAGARNAEPAKAAKSLTSQRSRVRAGRSGLLVTYFFAPFFSKQEPGLPTAQTELGIWGPSRADVNLAIVLALPSSYYLGMCLCLFFACLPPPPPLRIQIRRQDAYGCVGNHQMLFAHRIDRLRSPLDSARH